VKAFDVLGVVKLRLNLADDPRAVLSVSNNMDGMTGSRDHCRHHDRARRNATADDALAKRPKPHAFGRTLIEHVMVEDRNHLKGVAANLSEDQIIGAINVPALLRYRAEMKMVEAHDVQEEVLIGPPIIRRSAGYACRRGISPSVRLDRKVRRQVVAPFRLVEEGFDLRSVVRPQRGSA